ncbi:MAG: O-antigen ligase family protein [Gammaproteobacteria bacterium]
MRNKKLRGKRPNRPEKSEAHVRGAGQCESRIACAAVCVYWLFFGIPLPFDLSLLVLAGTSAWLAIASRPERSSHSYGKLVGLFVAAIILSLPGSQDIARSLRFIPVLLPSLMVFYLVSEKLAEEQLLWLADCIVVLALLSGLWLLWIAGNSFWATPTEWIKGAGMTFFRVPNDVVMLAILAPLALAAILRHSSKILTATGWLCLVVCTSVAVIYQSRLSVIVQAVGLGVAGFSMVGRGKLVLGGLLLLLFFLLTIDWLTGSVLLGKFSAARETRLPLWHAAWCMFLKAPIVGNGPGSYLQGYRECLVDPATGKLPPLGDERVAPWAHNLYLEVLAEQGIIGFFSLILLLAYGIVQLYSVRSLPDNAIKLLNSSLLALLIAFCVAANFELSLWRQWVTVLLLTSVGIAAKIYQS